MVLSFEIHFEVDLATSNVINALQTALVSAAPKFCEGLRVLEYERDSTASGVDIADAGGLHSAVVTKGVRRGPLFHQLERLRPPAQPRRFGDVLVRGNARASFLSVHFDEHAPLRQSGDQWLFSNSISGCIGVTRIGGVERALWVDKFLTALASHPAVVWGAAFDHAEFEDRNLHRGPEGIWALGRDASRSLPGLFWVNIFGAAYRNLIGDARLLGVKSVETRILGSSIFLKLYDTPGDWMTPRGRQHHSAALEGIGRCYFFDRGDPSARTVAPSFCLPDVGSRR